LKHGKLILAVLILLAVAVFAYSEYSGGDSLDDTAGDLFDDSLGDDVTSEDVGTDNTLDGPPLQTAWATIIAKVEAGVKSTARSIRNNNPGNLVEQGDSGTDADGYAVFSSYDAGWNALISDLTAKLRKYPTQTLAQIMARYAPAPDGSLLNAGNDPASYAATVAKYLSEAFDAVITPGTTLEQLQQIVNG